MHAESGVPYEISTANVAAVIGSTLPGLSCPLNQSQR